MAYPYQITNSANTHFQYVGRVIAKSATVLYKYLTDSANDTLEVWKSTDAGVTWAEADAAGHPTIFNGIVPIGDADDGTRLWFMYKNGASSPRLQAFNTATDLWEAAITGGPDAADSGGGGPITSFAQYGLQVRSNGDKVVFYTVNGSGNIQEQWARVYDGAWGTPFEVLVQNVNEAGFFVPYTNLGSVIDDDDAIHFFGWTPNGLAYVRVNADDSRSNYNRFGIDSINGETVGGRSGVYGQPRIVRLGQTFYATIPHGFLENIDGDTFIRPGMISVPIVGSSTDWRIDGAPQYANNINFASIGLDWLSICAAYDETTGTTWLIWIDDNSTVFDYQSVIKGIATRGAGWSTGVTTIYTPAVDEPIETMEITVDNGLFRAIIENSTSGTFLAPHYWQSSLVDTAPTICTTDFSGQNLSGYNFSNANFTGANLTGATGLPPTVPTLPQSSDPPLPPVWPYPFGGGVLYDREHLGMNIRMIREDDYVFSFQVIDELGNAYDLTSCSLKMTVKWNVRDADASAIFVCTSSPADGITINSPASEGDVTVEIASAKTTPLPLHRVFLPYDIRLTTATNKIKTIIHGTLRVDPNVTDPV